jgi:hypothetical protein
MNDLLQYKLFIRKILQPVHQLPACVQKTFRSIQLPLVALLDFTIRKNGETHRPPFVFVSKLKYFELQVTEKYLQFKKILHYFTDEIR